MVTILSHGNCTDGLIAAYVPWKWLKINNIETEVIFCGYGKPAPEVKFDNILIVDFSFKPEVIDEWCRAGKKVVMLDHHETAADMYGGYTNRCCANYEGGGFFTKQIIKEKSGAGLSALCVYLQKSPLSDFDFNKEVFIDLINIFNLKSKVEWSLHSWFTINRLTDNRDRLNDIISRTEDRDLWKFTFPDTNIYYELINSHDKTMEEVDKIVMFTEEQWNEDFISAKAKVQFRDKLAKDYASKAKTISFAGYQNVPIVNCPADFASKTCEILAKENPFAISFVMNTEQVFISLRSTEGVGENVAKIAEKYGGGGHKHSAGILFKTDQIVDLLQGKL